MGGGVRVVASVTRIALAAALLLIASPVAAADDWRPPTPDPLVTLDAALRPSLSAWQPAVDNVSAALDGALAPVAFGTIDAMTAALQERMEAVALLGTVMDEFVAVAVAGLVALDSVPPHPCTGDYSAAIRVGFLMSGDSAQSLQLGDLQTAGRQVAIAAYLVGETGDLFHAVAVDACA